MPKWHQKLGMDQRVEQLEQTVNSLITSQQLMENIIELFTRLNKSQPHHEGGSSQTVTLDTHERHGGNGNHKIEKNPPKMTQPNPCLKNSCLGFFFFLIIFIYRLVQF